MPDKQDNAPMPPIKRPKRGTKSRAIIKVAQENPTLTTREIGKLTDSDHSHVVKVLQRYQIEYERVQKFKDHRADILAGLQEKVVNSLSPADIEKAGLRDRAVVLGILHDHERLERGQSTQNVTHLHAVVRELQREEQLVAVNHDDE
jgi:hypothetical protein